MACRFGESERLAASVRPARFRATSQIKDLIRTKHMRRVSCLLILSLPILCIAQPSPSDVPWGPLNSFVGHWRGTSQGEPGHGQGRRDYEFVLRGRFLQLKNRTVYPPQQGNAKGETHEDLGLFSYDSQRKRFVLRQFHVEGFVNQYVETDRAPDSRTLVFISEGIENLPEGWRARETYQFVSQDEYTEVFELAPPQKDFSIYSESHWKRVN